MADEEGLEAVAHSATGISQNLPPANVGVLVVGVAVIVELLVKHLPNHPVVSCHKMHYRWLRGHLKELFRFVPKFVPSDFLPQGDEKQKHLPFPVEFKPPRMIPKMPRLVNVGLLLTGVACVVDLFLRNLPIHLVVSSHEKHYRWLRRMLAPNSLFGFKRFLLLRPAQQEANASDPHGQRCIRWPASFLPQLCFFLTEREEEVKGTTIFDKLLLHTVGKFFRNRDFLFIEWEGEHRSRFPRYKLSSRVKGVPTAVLRRPVGLQTRTNASYIVEEMRIHETRLRQSCKSNPTQKNKDCAQFKFIAVMRGEELNAQLAHIIVTGQLQDQPTGADNVIILGGGSRTKSGWPS